MMPDDLTCADSMSNDATVINLTPGGSSFVCEPAQTAGATCSVMLDSMPTSACSNGGVGFVTSCTRDPISTPQDALTPGYVALPILTTVVIDSSFVVTSSNQIIQGNVVISNLSLAEAGVTLTVTGVATILPGAVASFIASESGNYTILQGNYISGTFAAITASGSSSCQSPSSSAPNYSALSITVTVQCPSRSDGGGLSTGAIVGIVVGCVVGGVLVVVGIIIWRKRSNARWNIAQRQAAAVNMASY